MGPRLIVVLFHGVPRRRSIPVPRFFPSARHPPPPNRAESTNSRRSCSNGLCGRGPGVEQKGSRTAKTPDRSLVSRLRTGVALERETAPGPDGVQQPVQERDLALQELGPGQADPGPLDAVDLGELLPFPRTARPFELERVARACATSRSPSRAHTVDPLPAGLAQLSEADGGTGRHVESRLLPELPVGRGQGIVARVVLPLGDGPGSLVLPRPERTAGVRDQDLDDSTVPVIRYSSSPALLAPMVGAHHPIGPSQAESARGSVLGVSPCRGGRAGWP